MIVVAFDQDGRDWAEVRVDGEVYFRGHDDEAREYALSLAGVVEQYDESISGDRCSREVNVGACTCQPYWPVGHPNHICTCGAFVSNSVESGGTASDCLNCHGTGRIHQAFVGWNPCPICNGSGLSSGA